MLLFVLIEVLLKDFEKIDQVKEHLQGFDACFHCMGVSSAGKSEEQYHKLTFDITKSLVDACYEVNPTMVFTYVSGAGTDSTEKGNTMWARVKGKTENYILNKGFEDAYMFRAGAIIPEKGGMPDAMAIPSPSGRATKATLMAAIKSLCQFSSNPLKPFLGVVSIYLISQWFVNSKRID